jgi:hypothetical protein
MVGRSLAHYLVLEKIGAGAWASSTGRVTLDSTTRPARGDDQEDWLCRDPHLASIRNHPRFQQMLASVEYRRKQRHRASLESR